MAIKSTAATFLIALSAVLYGCAGTDGPSQDDLDAARAEASAAVAARDAAEERAATATAAREEAEAARRAAEERAATTAAAREEAEAARRAAEERAATTAAAREEAEAARRAAEERAATAAAARAETEAARRAAEERAATAAAALTDPLNRLNNIVGKVNAVDISRLHLGGSDGAGFRYECFPEACGGVNQAFLYAPAETSRWLFEDGFAQEREIGGLEIVHGDLEDGDWRVYGAWMDHAAVFLSRYRVAGENRESTDYFNASSFGSLSEEPLPVEGSAAWIGAMVGVNVVTTDRFAGSANLVANFGEDRRMDVSFTEIANVETGAPREDIVFSDLATVALYNENWIFGYSGHDDIKQAPIYINGRLYGPNHTEAAGVFGYNELIGAFGARKQE